MQASWRNSKPREVKTTITKVLALAVLLDLSTDYFERISWSFSVFEVFRVLRQNFWRDFFGRNNHFFVPKNEFGAKKKVFWAKNCVFSRHFPPISSPKFFFAPKWSLPSISLFLFNTTNAQISVTLEAHSLQILSSKSRSLNSSFVSVECVRGNLVEIVLRPDTQLVFFPPNPPRQIVLLKVRIIITSQPTFKKPTPWFISTQPILSATWWRSGPEKAIPGKWPVLWSSKRKSSPERILFFTIFHNQWTLEKWPAAQVYFFHA